MRAPELDRFLSPRHVDLLVTDQIESLQVRVREGIRVFERRVEQALGRATARTRPCLVMLVLGLLLGVLAAPEMPLHQTPAAWVLVLLGVFAIVFCGPYTLRLAADRRQLERLRRRYEGGVERFTTSAELLAFAEQVLSEAKAVGAVPPMTDDE